jgi:nucleoid-associated protein YgaU
MKLINKTTLDLPYQQARGHGGRRDLTQLIVIHATDGGGSAEEEAAFAARREDLTSCHVFVDTNSAVQVNKLDNVAFGCHPIGNGRSIQFELCGRSDHVPAATIARAALIVAPVARAWKIPVRHLSPGQARSGMKGLIGHDGVVATWHEGDHTDPGRHFPWGAFIRQVTAEVDRLDGDHQEPPPASHTHVVAAGDTLTAISKKFYGTANRWREIYAENMETIEAAAHAHGLADSDGGNRIFIGTELHIP